MKRTNLLDKFFSGIDLENTIKLLSLTDQELESSEHTMFTLEEEPKIYNYNKDDEQVKEESSSESESEEEDPRYRIQMDVNLEVKPEEGESSNPDPY